MSQQAQKMSHVVPKIEPSGISLFWISIGIILRVWDFIHE